MNMPKIPTNLGEELFAGKFVEPINPIIQLVNTANDNVWVIEEELKREYFRKESLQLIKSNVEHLKTVVNNESVKNLNVDLSHLQNAIDRGNEALFILGDFSMDSMAKVDEFINNILNEQSE